MREEDRINQSRYYEGIVSVRTLIENCQKKAADGEYFNGRKIVKVCVSEDRKAKNGSEYRWLSARAEELGFILDVIPSDVLDGMVQGTTHGGIIAEAGEHSFPALTAEIAERSRFAVMLDGIEDPFNFGYCLRSLYAAGCDCVILPERNWMAVSHIVCKSSAGASELLPMYIQSAEETAEIFRSVGHKVAAADLRDSVPIYDAPLSFPILLIIGGEKRGISRSVLDKCDIRVRIDYGRKFSASLSAASAATVVGFEIHRQNRNK